MRVFTAILLLLLCSFLSCSVKEKKRYGVIEGIFLGRWWNYYDRGVSFGEEGFWTEAERDIRTAVKKRDGDQRRARTHGLHFVDYFPHRELGISLFHLDRPEEAEKELVISLQQEESGRAKYYLNSVREEIINKQGTDRGPPLLHITSPSEGVITSDLNIKVSGYASDDQFIKEVSINGQSIFLELAEKRIPFTRDVKLKRGENHLFVTATDLSGKMVHKKIVVTVDRTGPLLSIDSVRQQGDGFSISGFIYDKTGVSQLKIGDKTVKGNNREEMPFNIDIPGKSGSFVSFKTTDSIGNSTEGRIQLITIQKTHADNFIRLAFMDIPSLNDVSGSQWPKVAMRSDTTPPFIKFRKGVEKRQTLFADSFYIEGEVSDPGKIVSLTINGEPLVLRPGIKLFFNYMAELQEGENEFVILARDRAGNQRREVLSIERKIPLVRQVSSRLTAGILPFIKKGNSKELTFLFRDSFLMALHNRNRFNIVARGQTFEAILRELKINTSDLADKATVVRLGKIVAAETVVAGTMVETPRFIQITARVVDTETSELMFVTDVYGEEKDISSFRYLVGGLALKITNRFPLVEGRVIQVKGEKIYIDLGANKNIRKNSRFLIYRNRGMDTETLHEVKAHEVFEKMSIGEVVRSFQDSPVKVMNPVITK